MALDKVELELIRGSWAPIRQDMVASGLLLFKDLFTKFPKYLAYFPQFAGLDLERMHENKRLIRHASKVIETVTFVVDSAGDECKSQQLGDALDHLVKGHLKRNIGLNEFRNLGLVLNDFVADFNSRETNLDAGQLISAWTKLYGVILDLVEKEAGRQE